MTTPAPIVELSPEQRELWQRVAELWELSKGGDADRIRATLHPDYVGWDLNARLPHDRETAVRSVLKDAPALREYELHPLSVRVYDGRTGVVHYAYAATVMPRGQAPMHVTGKWSEVYLKHDGVWLLISVSGRPDAA